LIHSSTFVERIDFDSTRWFSGESSRCGVSTTSTESQTKNCKNDNQGKDTGSNTTNKGGVQWSSSQDAVETTLSINACTQVGLVSVEGDVQRILIASVTDVWAAVWRFVGPDVVWLGIDPSAEGCIDTETISSTVVRALWGDKVGRRNAGVERRVSADIIFDTGTMGELVPCNSCVRAPGTGKTKSGCGSQTSRTVGSIQRGARRRWDGDGGVTGRSFPDGSIRVGCTNACSVDTSSMSRAEVSTVKAWWRWRSGQSTGVELVGRAFGVCHASSTNQSSW